MSDLVVGETNKQENAAKQRTKDIELSENVTFSDLGLSETVISGLKSCGFSKPSPIQLKAIPIGKLGLDLIVQAKSGTGKTCVFTVITLENLIIESRKLQALILAPTREVALQICEFIKKFHLTKLNCQAFIGGQLVADDKKRLQNCQIAVATPGRLKHLISNKLMKTDNIRVFVLDEADKLLSPEFQADINYIYSNLPENKQMIVLSATYPSYIATYVTRYMRSPTYVRLNKIDPSLRGIRQYYKLISNGSSASSGASCCYNLKVQELKKVLSEIQFTQSIVFTNLQLKAESLSQTLSDCGWPVKFISSNLEQTKRNEAIAELKDFKCRVLISTDLTARGIDAENVDLIICMDVPKDAETYLHRIGRAGRYGAYGIALSFVCESEELSLFNNIIDRYKLKISRYENEISDIVEIHNNNDDERNLIDDVTVERIKINSDELQQSLIDYEKAKIQTTNKYNFKTNEIPSKNEAQFCIFTSIKEIEEDMKNNNLQNIDAITLNSSKFSKDLKANTFDKGMINRAKREFMDLIKNKLTNNYRAAIKSEPIKLDKQSSKKESKSHRNKQVKDSNVNKNEEVHEENVEERVENTQVLDYINRLYHYNYYYNYYYSHFHKMLTKKS